MSSTNRGYDRHKSDYYITPINKIKQFLCQFTINNVIDNDEIIWFDPCAGGDKNNKMSYPEAIKSIYPYSKIITMDIRQDSLAQYKNMCYISEKLSFKPNIIITNPPFNIAKEIIEKALNDVTMGGYVVMLLRLNFLGSKGRENLFKNYMPKEIYVHSRRMSFTSDGKTDSIEYAHFVWQKGYNPVHSKLYYIPN